MRSKTCCFVFVFLLLSAAIWAQQKNQQSGRASQDDSLDATMKFIQEKLNSIGPVNYVSHGHDSSNGNDWTNRFKDEASEVIANPSICRIRYHWFTSGDGRVNMDKNVGFALKDVQQIRVLAREEIFNSDNAAAGHASWTAKLEPQVYVLIVKRPGNVENHFVFLDQELANRVAKSMSQAIELCGGKPNH